MLGLLLRPFSQRAPLLGKAIDNYREVLKDSPNLTEALMRLGTLERAMNQNDAALTSFEQAAKISPGKAGAYLNQATVLEAMGQKEKAKEALAGCLALIPTMSS